MFRLDLIAALSALAVFVSQEAQAQESSLPDVIAGYDEGFFLRSEDGSAEFKIEGLLQVLGRLNEPRRTPDSEFKLKRMRPEFSGRFDDIYRFLIEPKFDSDGVELEEAWAGMELVNCGSILKVGRIKVPFGLEEVRSRRHIAFPQFSILNQFSPAEQHGVLLTGDRNRWEYGVGVYNGTGGDEVDDGKEVVTRLMLHPFRDSGDSELENLQFGVAATYGREDRSVATNSIKSAAGLPLMTFAPGARDDGDQWRVGLEAAWFEGPNMAQAEVLWTRQDMTSAGGTSHVDMSGAYVSYQRALSGEEISFGGIRPQTSFRPGERERDGAWVAATRLSYLSADSALIESGSVLPGSFTSNITSLWLGMNWYLSDHVILRNSVVYSLYAGEVLVQGHTLSGEGALMTELQFHF